MSKISLHWIVSMLAMKVTMELLTMLTVECSCCNGRRTGVRRDWLPAGVDNEQ